MASYNYNAFSSKEYNLNSFHGPKLGEEAPNFKLCTASGTRPKTHLLDFKGQFLVLEMGSITCPIFQGRRKQMSHLVSEFSNISFSILYVREAHPGVKTPAHKTSQEKKDCAQALVENDKEQREIFIDDIDGNAHTAYGNYPNSIFIINKNKRIVFQSDWNNTNATRLALKQLLNGKPATVKSFFFPPNPVSVIKTLRRSGNRAVFDFLISLPKLIWKNLIRRNIRLLFNA